MGVACDSVIRRGILWGEPSTKILSQLIPCEDDSACVTDVNAVRRQRTFHLIYIVRNFPHFAIDDTRGLQELRRCHLILLLRQPVQPLQCILDLVIFNQFLEQLL